MATHLPDTVYVDDDWALPRVITPEFAAPGGTLEWVLATRGALAVVIAASTADIEVVDAVIGSVLVRVPRTITATVAAGRYEDALRTTVNGIVTTLSVGQVQVINSGFVVAGDSP